jgi:hypothetical protein
LVVLTAFSPAARTPFDRQHAPQRRRRHDGARLDEEVEQALVRRLPPDRLRRRNDDRPRARMDAAPAEIDAAWRRSVIVPFAQLPM